MRSNQPDTQSKETVTAPSPPVIQSGRLTRRESFQALALGLALAALAVGIAFFTAEREKKIAAVPPDHPRNLIEFNLTDRSGRTVTRTDLEGKILVVNFVFTGCSLSCRVVNNRMEEIQQRVSKAPDVQLVSITVDPRSDTPPVLAHFADSFHADTNRWYFLTGNKADVYRLLETSFIPRSPDLDDLIPGGFTSTDRIMVVDARGNVRASFDGLKRGVADVVVAEIQTLRNSLALK